MNFGAQSLRCHAKMLPAVILLAFVLGVVSVANATDNYPLRPPDTSSPRATLGGFIGTMDDVYGRLARMLAGYADSDRLYPTAEERRAQLNALASASEVTRYMDLSGIPSALMDTVAPERILQLKEILDRIDVPGPADIPDQETMTHQSRKRWRLPNTEIDIARIESGPRAGEYLVSAETIARLPESYERVKNLPYKPGLGETLSNIYRRLSRGGSATMYDAYRNSPVGLSFIIPPRWMLSLPDWAKARVFGLSSWQWLGLGLGFLVAGLIILVGYRASRRPDDAPGPNWRALLLPLAIIVVASILIPFLNRLFGIRGTVRVIGEYMRTGALVLATAWLAMVVGAVLGEAIVASERLTIASLDSQLIRLGTRLVGVVAAIAILIEGGDELGFPAFSVLAGLGVGGLAVALAAQSTIANLIGSLLIALEKPFRAGHYVRIGTTEGNVEDVGFRSTRIRTLNNSLVSIPSSTVVNTTVENLSVRAKRRQRFLVQVTYDTPREKLMELVAGIRQLIADHPFAEASSSQVRFNDFGESSLNILVIFHLLVTDYTAELTEREALLLQIMDLADNIGVEFAFPTRTLHLENMGDMATRPYSKGSAIRREDPSGSFRGRGAEREAHTPADDR